MNIFYVEPDRVKENEFELTGQEAQHATKVLRLRRGDEIHATNGQGKRLTGNVELLSRDSVTAFIKKTEEKAKPEPEIVLAMGILKKRDRLEFAVEKAVELGASEILLFNADHSEKTKVRFDRLENIAMSAMKQSLRFWLPKISVFDSLDEIVKSYPGAEILMAHERTLSSEQGTPNVEMMKKLLLVGPEGGFSDREVELIREKCGKLISLGDYRLRAETAVVAFLSRFI
ncbi:MAG: RsmE family RNA methyltransferase [Balneolaceae bacterium]